MIAVDPRARLPGGAVGAAAGALTGTLYGWLERRFRFDQ